MAETGATNNTGTDIDIVIAVGTAIKTKKDSFQDVFHRADVLMYKNKNQLKKKRPSHSLR